MTIPQVVVSVLFANGLTAAVIYAAARSRRDGADGKAIAILIAVGIVTMLMGYAARSSL